MNEITLQLPNTLYMHLEILAEKESIPLNQYIIFILTRQMSEDYTVRVIPDHDIENQKASFNSLIKKWGKISSSEADRILESREPAEIEPSLSPEVISRLKERIERSKPKS